MSMTVNFGRVGMNNEEFPSIKSFDPLILQDNVKYFSFFITTITKSMDTKLGKVVTYCKTFHSWGHVIN